MTKYLSTDKELGSVVRVLAVAVLAPAAVLMLILSIVFTWSALWLILALFGFVIFVSVIVLVIVGTDMLLEKVLNSRRNKTKVSSSKASD